MRYFRRLTPGFLVMQAAFAQQVGAPTGDLDKLGMDELFNLQVTSVGRKAQELSKAPAAVFVLTAEDIRRSGATSIPEALQWVPGLTVLSLDGRSWVVSARGGARLYADKMLVMLDGQSLYTPTFSGVVWDMITIPMQEIERIEVVRGPGAVMWGLNAVDGVINIITRSAGSSRSGQVSQSNGNEVRDLTEASWGGPVNDRLSYRVWGSFGYRSPAFGSPGFDMLNDTIPYQSGKVSNMDEGTGSAGFRVEGTAGSKDQWGAEGTFYKVTRQDPVVYSVLIPDVVDFSQRHSDYIGGDIQAHWTRTTAPGNESTFQFSYSRYNADYPYMGGETHNLNLNYQKRRPAGENNEIYWGAGYQQYWDSIVTTRLLSFSPPSAVYRAGDVVVRDEYQFVPGRLMASAGLRLDYNSFTHLEYQPSLRLIYTPSQNQSAWMSISRAVRVPNRINRNLVYDGGILPVDGMPVSLPSYGSESLRSETERSVEAGYRLQSGQRWSIDASLYLSSYGRMIGLGGPSIPIVTFAGGVPLIEDPYTYCNCGRGRSYGGELSAVWQVREGWRLLPSYSYLNENRWLAAPSVNTYSWDTLLATVPHQFLLRSQHDLSRKWQLDLMARARSRNKGMDLSGAFLLDIRLGWRPTRSGEVSVGVHNLTNRQLLETYAENPFLSIPIRRTFSIKWTQRF
jgi:iron complex outermembrane recepter protein